MSGPAFVPTLEELTEVLIDLCGEHGDKIVTFGGGDDSLFSPGFDGTTPGIVIQHLAETIIVYVPRVAA